jgi:phosphohistidine phosphatase
MVIMVGHNPETTSFANLLGGLDIYNVPTCGIVTLDFDIGTWKDVGRKNGRLIFFDYPRKVDNQVAD